jgi:type VI secretion system protein ImpB
MDIMSVQITYDDPAYEDGQQKKELPMVLGILSALSGSTRHKNDIPLSERRFYTIDHLNFFQIMAKINPSLDITVKNEVTPQDSSVLDLTLTFESLADFEPGNLIQKIDILQELSKVWKKVYEYNKPYKDLSLLKELNALVFAHTGQHTPLKAPAGCSPFVTHFVEK